MAGLHGCGSEDKPSGTVVSGRRMFEVLRLRLTPLAGDVFDFGLLLVLILYVLVLPLTPDDDL